MRRLAFFSLLCGAAMVACGDDDPAGTLSFQYSIVPPPQAVTVRQDLTVPLGVKVVRDGDTLTGVRLNYQSADVSIARVDANGNVTGIKGGTTNITASGPATSLDVPVTVTSYTATSVVLSVLSGPGGGLLATTLDTGTFFGLPADRTTARLKGLVRVNNDTVFCNYCPTTTQLRRRIVRFYSLDDSLATVSNPSDPTLQTSVDTAGRVTVRDTASGGVRFVLEVPADGISDTVLVKLKLRPIDSITVRPDSNIFPAAGGTGLTKQRYPGDELQTNIIQSTTTNFVAGVTFLSRVQDLPAFGASTPAPRWIPITPTGGVAAKRTNLPSITWESANIPYLQINAAGALVAPCAFLGGACSTASQTTLNAQVLTCADNAGKIPQTDFNGPGTYNIPSCVNPVRTIPMPGAFCSTASSTDLSSTCAIWIRATVTDQAIPTRVLQRYYRVNVRR